MSFKINDSTDGLEKIYPESTYVCLVTTNAVENYLEKGNMFHESEKANKIGCNMYAVVQKSTIKPEVILDKYKWSGIYYFDKDSDMEPAVNEMKRDVMNREIGR